MTLDWTYDDQAIAGSEGWDLFFIGDSDHELYEMERIDDPELFGLDGPGFPDDVDAWQHVIARASAGSVLHNKALAFLAQEAPGELVHIALNLTCDDLNPTCPCRSCNRKDH